MGDGARLNDAGELIPLPDGRILILDGGVVRYATEVVQAPFFVPVVLSSEGLNHALFTTELTLTNRSSNEVNVGFSYAAASGGGSGSFTDPVVLGPGRQRIIPDAIEFLASRGLKIASSGPRYGTLWVTLQGVAGNDASVSARTTTPVAGENPRNFPFSTAGRAGLAYAGVRPGGLLTGTAYLSGLRVTGDERSNVAVQNAGTDADGAIGVRLSLFAGDGNGAPVGTQEFSIPPGGFAQERRQSTGERRSNQGYFAKTERLSGWLPTTPMVSSTTTQPPMAPSSRPTFQMESRLPDSPFPSPWKRLLFDGADPQQLQRRRKAGESNLRLDGHRRGRGVNGAVPASGLTTPATELRGRPAEIWRRWGRSGGPGFIGPVFVTASTGDIDGLAVSAKTTNPNPAGSGNLGLDYQGVPSGSTSASAWISGLQQDVQNRSNMVLVNTGEKAVHP